VKITDVEITKLAVPCQLTYHSKIMEKLNYVLVQIPTNEGITGIGCIPVQHLNPWTIAEIIERNFKKFLVGADPLESERIWYQLYGEIHRDRKGIAFRALSAVDIAIWDIKGKALKLPLYRLLGGSRAQVPCYASGGYYGLNYGKTTKELAEEMTSFVEKGFNAIKMKVGSLTIDEDVRRVKAVRESIGDSINLIVDANNAYAVGQAIKIGRKLEKYDVYWFEEPVWVDDVRGCADVAKALDVPIAAGQNEYTRYGFRDLIENRAVDIVQPDVTVIGGISEWLKVAGMASAFNIPIAPHWDGSIGMPWDQEVHTHLAAVVPSVLRVEFFRPKVGDYPSIVDGCIPVPEKVGLGVEQPIRGMEGFRIE
jgi:L-alanine-DL-glutamate epimerase-like enolase superfamily enzyme